MPASLQLVRVAPGGTPTLENGFLAVDAGEPMPAVTLRIDPKRADSFEPYWKALQGTQDFFGHPAPRREDLEAAVATFREHADAAVVATVFLGPDGSVLVSGQPSIRQQPLEAVLIRLEPAEDRLSPRGDWQRQAFGTNARAQVDAFRRALSERGAQDALVHHDGHRLSTIVGAVALLVGQRLAVTPSTTIVPDLFDTLRLTGGIIVRAGLEVGEASEQDLQAAERAWWLSPELNLSPVTTLAGRALPQIPGASDDVLVLP